MRILGLTGSIGMGKSTTAKIFRRHHIPVFDADGAVHSLLAKGGKAVPAIARAFPQAVIDDAVDRARLGAQVFGDPARLARLEAILHPMVRDAQNAFLSRCRRRRVPWVVLDVPLLLEKTGWRVCDRVAVVTAPAFLQAQRVLARPGQSSQRLAQIRRAQMSDSDKRRAADFIIPTGLGMAPALRKVRRTIRLMGIVRGKKHCAKLYWIRKPPGSIR
jgi:dephospho-CoA kinase